MSAFEQLVEDEIAAICLKRHVAMPVASPAQETVDTYVGVLVTLISFEGYISKKELEWDGHHDTIPAEALLGEDGQVHIWGTSSMPVSKIMRCRWKIKDPDGYTAQTYERKTLFGVGAYGTEEFVGPKFGLDKAGSYTIDVELLLED